MDAARRAWLVPVGVFAAVAATVVAVSTSGGQGGTSSRKPRALPIGSAGGAADARTAEAATAPDRAVPAPGYYGWAPYRLVVELPDDLPKEAAAYRVQSSQADALAVRRLATALGLDGEPVRESDHWRVSDGVHALMVWDHAGQSWSFGPDYAACKVDTSSGATEPDKAPPPPSEPTAEPEKPAEPAEPAPMPMPEDGCRYGGSSGVAVACAPDQPCEKPSQPPSPSENEALTVARKTLAAAGYDVTAGEFTVHDGWGSKNVSFAPRIGGLRTMFWEATVEVDAELEVRHANGRLLAAERYDTYPLLTPQQAIDRVNKQAPSMPRCEAMTPECQGEPTPRDVTAVELGLVFYPSYRDYKVGYLVPAWLLTVKDAGTQPEPVHALPDEYLEKPPPAEECKDGDACVRPMPAEDQPMPVDGGGTDGSAGSGSSTGGDTPVSEPTRK